MVTSGLQVPMCLSPAHLITQERSWQNHEVGELFQGVEARDHSLLRVRNLRAVINPLVRV